MFVERLVGVDVTSGTGTSNADAYMDLRQIVEDMGRGCLFRLFGDDGEVRLAVDLRDYDAVRFGVRQGNPDFAYVVPAEQWDEIGIVEVPQQDSPAQLVVRFASLDSPITEP